MEKEPSRRKFVQNFPKKTSPAGATPKANAKVWGTLGTLAHSYLITFMA
jgi:hypothetical protein